MCPLNRTREAASAICASQNMADRRTTIRREGAGVASFKGV